MKPHPWWFSAAQFTGIGWYIASAIVFPTLLGDWIDGKVGSAPLLLLTGLLLGVVAAFYGTYKIASGYWSGSPPEDSE